METQLAIAKLKAIIAEEREKGCPMADESFIEPALRRWNSYERRAMASKDKSLSHRAHDLEKGLLAWCVERYGQGYDRGCVQHLAQSFAAALCSDLNGH